MSKVKEQARYERAVLQSAKKNHVWLNAFACVRPTEDFEREVGRIVLRNLNDPESLIEMKPIGTLVQKCLILRINKS